jgi:SAM-dependent methyltransferase
MLPTLKSRLSTKLTRQRLAAFLELHGTDARTLEVGAKHKPYQRLFPCTVSGDITPYPALDAQFDAHALPFAGASFAVVLCTEVLEHCRQPHQVIAEFHRVLQPGGKLILTTRFLFPIHDTPHDYFRFTKYGLQSLCEAFSQVTIIEEAATVETMGVLYQRLAYQVNWKLPLMRLFLHLFARLLTRAQGLVREEYGDITRASREHNIMASGYYLVAIK